MTALTALGQVPFAPPSVGGWPENQAWLSTAASLQRLQLAAQMVAQPAAAPVLDTVAAAAVINRPDVAAHLLSLDSWSPGSAGALRSVADDPPKLLTLALVAPEYVGN